MPRLNVGMLERVVHLAQRYNLYVVRRREGGHEGSMDRVGPQLIDHKDVCLFIRGSHDNGMEVRDNAFGVDAVCCDHIVKWGLEWGHLLGLKPICRS